MAVLTVNTPGGGVETFDDVDLDGTVKTFKTAVGARVGMASFQLHAYIRTGTIFLKTSLLDASLTEVGLRDGAELRLRPPGGAEKCQQAQRRLDLGTIRRATSLKRRFDKVSADVVEDGDKTRNAVAGVASDVVVLKADAGSILGVMRGEAAPNRPGQTNKDRLKEIRLVKRVLDNEAGDLREKEGIRIATGKRQRNEETIAAAVVVDGNVAMAADAMPGQSLAEKEAAHKAQGKVLTAAKRVAKAEEKAVAKAAAKAAARGAA